MKDTIKHIEKLYKDSHLRSEERLRRQLYNRLHVTLMTMPGLDREETRQMLGKLEQASPAERQVMIKERFGDKVLEFVQPALRALEGAMEQKGERAPDQV